MDGVKRRSFDARGKSAEDLAKKEGEKLTHKTQILSKPGRPYRTLFEPHFPGKKPRRLDLLIRCEKELGDLAALLSDTSIDGDSSK